jgi:ketosteroid isomerase-like protein
MKESAVKIVGVPGVSEVPLTGRDSQPIKPFDLPAAHIFKVRGGKIHEIEAMGFSVPYDSRTGWE